MTAEEISQVLSEEWSLTAYPRDVSSRIIQRLLENSSSYYIAQLPDPEPEENPEEAEPAELGAPEQQVPEPKNPEPVPAEADGKRGYLLFVPSVLKCKRLCILKFIRLGALFSETRFVPEPLRSEA